MEYKKATELLQNGHVSDCIDFFKSNGYDLEYAYALLLTDKKDEACRLLDDIDSVRADWLKKVIHIINGEIVYPTFFQIRNFLEIDMTLFFNCKRIDYINALLRQADIFQSVNSEAYKLFGRGLLKNNFPKECKIFLDKSLNEYYNDVELHYLFAEYYLYLNDLKNAKKAAENCLKINPQYYPAKRTYQLLNK